MKNWLEAGKYAVFWKSKEVFLIIGCDTFRESGMNDKDLKKIGRIWDL